MDLHQLWTIISLPDNVPIVLLMIVVPFYTWYALRQAFANDKLIAQLEANPALAKTHHRKTQPWKPGWAKEVHVWPYLLRIEFLAAIIVTLILMVWSITLNAPLEEPSNPTLTMNPSKAPWYFLGLQEMLVYFDPWIAGVVMPSLIIVGLMAIPYIDANPLGNGYYTFKQRKSAIMTFIFGFIVLWVTMIVIGTLIRGPGWMWFWPGTTWDHNRLEFAVNRDLPDIFGVKGRIAKIFFGAVVCGLYAAVAGWFIHKLIAGRSLVIGKWKLIKEQPFNQKIFKRMSLLQYVVMQTFLIIMLALPIKILARLLFRIKYVWVTPWFNV
jgi:hypothetical protein